MDLADSLVGFATAAAVSICLIIFEAALSSSADLFP